jgi:hypothetical protein
MTSSWNDSARRTPPCAWSGTSQKNSNLVREGTAVKYAAIADWADDKQYPVTFMCAQLGLTRQGYYRWLATGPSERDRTHAQLTTQI